MTARELEAGKDFGRYLDVDGDGIPFRTYPGTHPTKGSFFTRGTSRDRYARYTEEGGAYADNMQRLLRKFETAKDLVPRPLHANAEQADQVRRDLLRLDLARDGRGDRMSCEASGHMLDRMRVRAFPFHSSVTSFIADHDFVFVVEQNRDAQLRTLIVNECGIDPVRLVPILHYDGTPITARFIAEAIGEHLDRAQSHAAAQGGVMTYIAKPKFHHPGLPKNALGYTHRDYEGAISTLCAGCGHDSITAAIIEACFELAIEPHRVAKLSGIGCSSKTPDYFLGKSHGFNSVHGRMPSVLTGANLANRDLIYLGVSGDGDSRLDRARPVRACDAARRQHGLHRREQRRVRPDQGPVLRDRRPRLEVEARRRSTTTRRSTSSRWRCSSARPSWRAASPATSTSWCR